MMSLPSARVLVGDAKVERARSMGRAHKYRRIARAAASVESQVFWLNICAAHIRMARTQNKHVVFWMAKHRARHQ